MATARNPSVLLRGRHEGEQDLEDREPDFVRTSSPATREIASVGGGPPTFPNHRKQNDAAHKARSVAGSRRSTRAGPFMRGRREPSVHHLLGGSAAAKPTLTALPATLYPWQLGWPKPPALTPDICPAPGAASPPPCGTISKMMLSRRVGSPAAATPAGT